MYIKKKTIDKETIRILFNCGRKAPRSQGNEFIEFYFIQSKEILEQIFWFCPGMDEKPELILDVAIKGLVNIFDGCKKFKIRNLFKHWHVF